MLELQTVTVEGGGKDIVRDVTFTIPSRSISILMGPNGSGKSSFVNSIMGHPNYRISLGKAMFFGEDITHKSALEKARLGLFLSTQHVPKIGGISLATFLHKAYTTLTGVDVSILEFYLDLQRKAEKYGIPKHLLDRPISEGLSGGEKKLSDILQLAILRPKIAILDEIDSGVDVDALRTVFAVIKSLREEGVGFLLISHHPSLLEYVTPDHVHILAHGRLVRSGGKELAETVLSKGFCASFNCVHAGTCGGSCGIPAE